MFSRSMRVKVGIDRKCELSDYEAAARKTLYNEGMRGIPPARAYDQVPVCQNCFSAYNILNKRREDVFDLTEKGGGFGMPGKKASEHSKSAAKQWNKSLSHSAGVGNQRGLERLTAQEMKGAEARKRLLQRREKEIEEMEKRVERAEAKKNALFVVVRKVDSGKRGGKKKKKKKKMMMMMMKGRSGSGSGNKQVAMEGDASNGGSGRLMWEDGEPTHEGPQAPPLQQVSPQVAPNCNCIVADADASKLEY